MRVDLEHFGLRDVPVDPQTVITFPDGLAGFEHCQRFKVFHEEGKQTVFWLQSVDDTAVMFPIVAPEILAVHYEIELSDTDCALLELDSPEDAVLAVIVYRNPAQGGNIVANTRSPLILNLRCRRGIQKILHELSPAVLYRGR